MHPPIRATCCDYALLTRRRLLSLAPAAAGAVWLAGQGNGAAAGRMAAADASFAPNATRVQRVIRLHVSGGRCAGPIARSVAPLAASPDGWLEIALADAPPQTELPDHIVLGPCGVVDLGHHQRPSENGGLPPAEQAIHCHEQGDPVLFLSDPAGAIRPPRSETLSMISALRRHRYQQLRGSSAPLAVAQHELAFRMQRAASEAVDIGREPAATLHAYGARPGQPSFANRCLLARRLAQRGVRCVQLVEADGDADSTRRAIAALLADLHQLGLLSVVNLPSSRRV